MYRPFGDHTGENKPCDPGTIETCRVTRSRIRICDVTSWPLPPKRTWLPSGDQLGSPVQSSGMSVLGGPPSREISATLEGLFLTHAENTSDLPSGDHRGL